MPDDAVILVLLPDTGERYLSKAHSEEWLKENRLLEGYDPKVGEILERHPQGIPPLVKVDGSTLVREAISLVRQYEVSQVPVLRDQENLGVLQESKLLRLAFEDASILERRVDEVMDPPLPEISLHETTDRAKEFLTQRDAAVLVRDGARLVGILTRYDLLDYVL
jgi:cystathionine beta-synthase